MRDKRYTYAIYHVNGQELLFDRIEDPYQLNNLINNKDYQGVLNNFRQLLKVKMDAINDNFEKSGYYQENWVEDRIIKRTATMRL